MTSWRRWSLAIVLIWILVATLEAAKQDASRPLLIGGIFEQGSRKSEAAFEEALRRAAKAFRPRTEGRTFFIAPNDVTAANNSVCALLRQGAVGIITDAGAQVSELVGRAAALAEVPHLTLAAWPAPIGDFTVRLRPSFAAILKTAFQAPPSSPGGNAAFITAGGEADPKRRILRRLFPAVSFHLWRSGAEAALLETLTSAGVRNFYLDMPPEDVLQLLRTAYQNRMDLADFNFIIIATDFGAVRGAVAPLAEMAYEMHSKVWIKSLTTLNRPANEALIMDGVYLLSKALNDLYSSVAVTPRSIKCWSSSEYMQSGTSLLNYVLLGVTSGANTGPVEFDGSTRERNRFSFISKNVGEMAVRPTRMWVRPTRILSARSNTRRVTTKSVTKRSTEGVISITKRAADPLTKKTLRVVVVPSPPFLTVRQEKGKPAYVGHNIDLLKRLAKELGFNFTIHVSGDGKFGMEKNGRWTGMIGELLEGRADLAVAPLTITYKRQRVVDFTYSFMNFGLKILTFRPVNFVPSPETFLLPLTPAVWIVLLVAYVIVSFAIFLIAKLSPFEWHRSSHGSAVRINDFSLLNAFWFAIGGCLRQYPGMAPRSTSVRLLSGVWWVVVLLFFLYYVCNLYPMISTASASPPFSSFNDLADQNAVKFGCLRGSSTEAYFKNSKIIAYQKIYKRMQETPGSFKDSYSQGIRDVLRKNGSYAFIGESTILERMEKRECKLRTLPGSINNQAYGFALPKNSAYTASINAALLKLKEQDVFEELDLTYFRQNAASCGADLKAQPYSLQEVKFLLVLLILGLILAFVLAVLECICNRCCGVGRQPTETPLTDFRTSLSATKREIS